MVRKSMPELMTARRRRPAADCPFQLHKPYGTDRRAKEEEEEEEEAGGPQK